MSLTRKSILEQTFLTTQNYEDTVNMSERAAWLLSDVLKPEDELDFSKPFLPPALLDTSKVSFLSDEELLHLNHIVSFSYLHLFFFVEEFIIALMIEELHAETYGDLQTIRSLSRFTDEEVKHQLLFQSFKKLFNKSFGIQCRELESAVEVAQALLEYSNLAILIATLHFEVITQAHYTATIQENQNIDPLFSKLLHFHWKEECQHAQIDLLKLQKHSTQSSLLEIRSGFEEYCEILKTFKEFLYQQSQMNFESLKEKLGRTFSQDEQAAIIETSLTSLFDMFITFGIEHKQLIDCLKKFVFNAEERLQDLKQELSAGL